MKILIDARLYGLEHVGIGRYVMELLNYLQSADKINDYLILLRENQAKKFKIENLKLKIKIVEVPHYSLQEQVKLPKILNKLDFDIAHFPHFNVPLFFNKPFIVTIHDLIKHTSTGPQTTTRAPFLYWLKYWGYKIVFKNAVTRAQKIIVPSQAVKDELLKTYHLPQKKVVVIYEGVEEVFKSQIINSESQTILKKYKRSNPYIIYTGSVYPHKNLERLIAAVKELNNSNYLTNKISLIIVNARNVFLERLQGEVRRHGMEKFIRFLGFVEDSELTQLYKNAKAFVLPSLSEGFGLPGLEAMAAGCPVICSDIPVFREVYKDAAIYFNPQDVNDIGAKINEVLRFDESIHQNKVTAGKKRASQFSWHKMAKETLEVYSGLNLQVST